MHKPGAISKFDDIDEIMKNPQSNLPFSGSADVPNALTQLALQVPELRAIADKLLCDVKNESNCQAVIRLINRCQNLDTALASWCETIPTQWAYTSSPYSKSIPCQCDDDFSDVYPGNIDTYPDVWVAKSWNSYRTARIFVLAILLRCFGWLAMAPGMQQELQISVALKARDTVKQMVDEICASVHFHMAHNATVGANHDSLRSQTSSVDPWKPYDPAAFQVGEDMHATESIGGYFLVWPLFVARSVPTTPEWQKHWIAARLLDIARKFGLDEGVIMSKLNEPPAHGLFRVSATSSMPFR
jgi:hypothetical protein